MLPFLISNTNFIMDPKAAKKFIEASRKQDEKGYVDSEKLKSGLEEPNKIVNMLRDLDVDLKGDGSLYDNFKLELNNLDINGGTHDTDPNNFTPEEAKEAMKNMGKEWLNQGLKVGDNLITKISNDEDIGWALDAVGKTSNLIKTGTDLFKGTQEAHENFQKGLDDKDKKVYDPFHNNSSMDDALSVTEAAIDDWVDVLDRVEDIIGVKVGTPVAPECEGISEVQRFAATMADNPDLKKLVNSQDFAPNIYDVFFEINGKIDYLSEEFNMKKLRAATESPILLSSRIHSIEVPGITATSNDIPFCGTTIPILTNKFEDPHQSTFSIRADQELFWIDIFNKIAGTDDYGTMPNYFKSISKAYNSLFHENIPYSVVKKIALGEFPQVNLDTLKRIDPKKTHLNIYVRWLPGWGRKVRSVDEKSLHKDIGNVIYSKRLFKFEDVKILGTSSSVEFTRDGANTMVFNYEFIYRNVYERYYDKDVDEIPPNASTGDDAVDDMVDNAKNMLTGGN